MALLSEKQYFKKLSMLQSVFIKEKEPGKKISAKRRLDDFLNKAVYLKWCDGKNYKNINELASA